MECSWNSSKRKVNNTKMPFRELEYKFYIPFTLSAEQPMQKSAWHCGFGHRADICKTSLNFLKHLWGECIWRNKWLILCVCLQMLLPVLPLTYNVINCWQDLFLRFTVHFSLTCTLHRHTNTCTQMFCSFLLRGTTWDMQSLPLLSKPLLLYNLFAKSSYISITLGGSLPLIRTVFTGNPESQV